MRKQNLQGNFLTCNINEFNVIFLILIGILLIGMAGGSSFALFSGETNSTAKITGTVVSPKGPTAAEELIAKVGTGGLVADEHPATEQLAATTDYRYTGANPDNYVSFNDELWRIIGVFDVDDGTGKLEKRIKLIRDEMIGKMGWNDITNTWTYSAPYKSLNFSYLYGKNDYLENGLDSYYRSQVADAKWYLGGANTWQASSIYSSERGEITEYPWIGKVGIMYASDYAYATSGGTTDRNTCLKSVGEWSGLEGCAENDWLYTEGANHYIWTLTRLNDNEGNQRYFVIDWGALSATQPVDIAPDMEIFPTVYLKANVSFYVGTGTKTDPYFLDSGYEPKFGAKTLLKNEGIGKEEIKNGFFESETMVIDIHDITTQFPATVSFRYIGANPNNYVRFNDELWRIIGVFETYEDFSDNSNLEYRIKLIRNESIGILPIDDGTGGPFGNYGVEPDPTTFSLLNSGDYWNREGDYAEIGLTKDAKSMISEVKWYVGQASEEQYPHISASKFYYNERETDEYLYPTPWMGKVGLMYASDYVYATAVNSDMMERSRYFYYSMYDLTTMPEYYENNWLYGINEWTLSANANLEEMFFVSPDDGIASEQIYNDYDHGMRPTVYLKPTIKVIGGTGTESDPYQLSI